MKPAFQTKVSRRALLRGAVLGAGAIALAACGDDEEPAAPAAIAPASPTDAVATATPQVRGPRWTRLEPQGVRPLARRDHSLIFDSDRGVLYVFGGRAAGTTLGDLWSYDLTTSQWMEIAPSGERPDARFGHNALYDAERRRLVVALGQASSSDFFNDTWAFDPAASTWSRIGEEGSERPAVRYGSAGAGDRSGGRLLISHGFTNQGRFDDTWSLDMAGGAWRRTATSGALPVERCLTRGFWDRAGGRFFMFAGQTDAEPFLGDFWSLDEAAGGWTQLTPAALPSPRNLYGAAFDEAARRWYVVGGATADGPVADVWVYDVAAGAWSQVIGFETKDEPPARRALDLAFGEGTVYLFGGNGADGDLDDLWQLDPGSV